MSLKAGGLLVSYRVLSVSLLDTKSFVLILLLQSGNPGGVSVEWVYVSEFEFFFSYITVCLVLWEWSVDKGTCYQAWCLSVTPGVHVVDWREVTEPYRLLSDAPTHAVAHTCLHMLHMQILHCKEHLLTVPSTLCFHDLAAFCAAPCEDRRTRLTWLTAVSVLLGIILSGAHSSRKPFGKTSQKTCPREDLFERLRTGRD